MILHDRATCTASRVHPLHPPIRRLDVHRSVMPPKMQLWRTWPAASWVRAPAARSCSAKLARAALRITSVRATQPTRILGGLGSSWPHVTRPALSRADGRCTVRRHHRRRCDERHAPPTLRAAHPHAPRAAARPRTTSIGTFIVDGETALQLTQRRASASLSYQWYIGDAPSTMTPITDGTGNGSTLTTKALTSTTKYWVKVMTTGTGCSSRSVNSATATVNVCQRVQITAQPQANTATRTASVTLKVTATGSVTSYQWYEGAKGVTTKPVGTNSNTLTIVPGTTKSYWVRVSGACGGADSEAALQSVVPEVTAPQPVNACAGQNATFTVTSTGDPATLTYQWYRRLSGGADEPVGTNSPALTVAATANMTVWCVVTSGVVSTASLCADLTIAPAPLIITTKITKDPWGKYTMSLTMSEADAPDATYHWYEGAVGNTSIDLGTWSNYYSVYPSSVPRWYWVRVTNQYTGCSTNQAFELR
jgi:hypothetical protein